MEVLNDLNTNITWAQNATCSRLRSNTQRQSLEQGITPWSAVRVNPLSIFGYLSFSNRRAPKDTEDSKGDLPGCRSLHIFACLSLVGITSRVRKLAWASVKVEERGTISLQLQIQRHHCSIIVSWVYAVRYIHLGNTIRHRSLLIYHPHVSTSLSIFSWRAYTEEQSLLSI